MIKNKCFNVIFIMLEAFEGIWKDSEQMCVNSVSGKFAHKSFIQDEHV